MNLKRIKRYFKIHWLLTLFSLFSLLSYASVFIPPTVFWPAVFASYAIPGILILNLLVLLTIPFYRKTLVLFPLISLLIGTPFILITYSFMGEKEFDYHDLSILSYNVKFFRMSDTYDKFSTELIAWVSKDSSEVKCLQEYCTNSYYPKLNATKTIAEKGYDSFVFAAKGKVSNHDQGLAIFSKYDILDTGFVWENYGSINAGIFADIKIGLDTIRIYNVHLESMGLFLHQYKYAEQYDSKMKSLISKLKRGAEKRSNQIEKLIYHTNNCPFPYIICGDFNDTPYSYNYFTLKQHFANAFEDAGNGFGFSFNSLLFFLRIDHHFFNGKIEAVNYRVDRSMKISDHFPTRGFYRIQKN